MGRVQQQGLTSGKSNLWSQDVHTIFWNKIILPWLDGSDKGLLDLSESIANLHFSDSLLKVVMPHLLCAEPKIACSCLQRIRWTYFLNPSSGEWGWGAGISKKPNFIPALKQKKASCKKGIKSKCGDCGCLAPVGVDYLTRILCFCRSWLCSIYCVPAQLLQLTRLHWYNSLSSLSVGIKAVNGISISVSKTWKSSLWEESDWPVPFYQSWNPSLWVPLWCSKHQLGFLTLPQTAAGLLLPHAVTVLKEHLES